MVGKDTYTRQQGKQGLTEKKRQKKERYVPNEQHNILVLSRLEPASPCIE
jgi:hypothetical protein